MRLSFAIALVALLSVLLLGARCATTRGIGVLYLPPDLDGTSTPVVLESTETGTWVEVPDQSMHQGDCILGAARTLIWMRQCRDGLDANSEPVRLCSEQAIYCCTLDCCDPAEGACDSTVCSASELLECPIADRCRNPMDICDRLFLWPELQVPQVVVVREEPPLPPPPPPPPPQPGIVGTVDLRYLGGGMLAWTEVTDGLGEPASYDLRYGIPQISWGAAYPTSVVIPGTAIGQTIQVQGAIPGAQYQLVPFRGTLNLDAVFGPLSNIVLVP